MATPNKNKTLFLLYDIDRTLLYVTKSCNMQKLVFAEWWPKVHHIITKHFDSTDELDDARYATLEKGTKWNVYNQPFSM